MHRLFSLFFLAGIAGAVIQLMAGTWRHRGALSMPCGNPLIWQLGELGLDRGAGPVERPACPAEASRRLIASGWVTPVLACVMPGIARTLEAAAPVSMNLAANMLLDNAATPLGLKAMESLQKDNPSRAAPPTARSCFWCSIRHR